MKPALTGIRIHALGIVPLAQREETTMAGITHQRRPDQRQVSFWSWSYLKVLLVSGLLIPTAPAFAQTAAPEQIASADPAPAQTDSQTTSPDQAAPAQTQTSSLVVTGGSSATFIGGSAVPEAAKVGNSGAATYSIPITVAPGVAKLQPNLSLVYNSQSRKNELLGVSWSIGGLPTIERCKATIAQDGFAGTINYDPNDRFCMDGLRLMAVSGSYGGNLTEYRTEVDIGIKVISHDQAGSGPAWFEAKTKDGKIMEFGKEGYSDIHAADIQGVPRSDIRVWALSSIRDTKGNTVSFTYMRDNTIGHYHPNQIAYTSNGSLQANRFVVFTVEDRPDTFPMYLGGSVVTVAKRITNIKTYVGGTDAGNLVRDYKLTYECNINDCNTATKRSRLKTISECDKNGNCLPAETTASVSYTFTYQEGGDSTLTYNQFDVNDNQWDPTKAWTGDFNSDGLMDIASKDNNSMWVHLSDGAGNFTPVETPVQSYAFDGTKLWVGDYNGDGRSDFATHNNGKIWTYLAKSDDSGQFELPIQYNSEPWQINP
jgi:hypothetical protein